MKNLVLLILFLFLSLNSISCNSKDSRNTNSILYWSSNNTEEITFAKEKVDEWNKNHPAQKNIFSTSS